MFRKHIAHFAGRLLHITNVHLWLQIQLEAFPFLDISSEHLRLTPHSEVHQEVLDFRRMCGYACSHCIDVLSGGSIMYQPRCEEENRSLITIDSVLHAGDPGTRLR